MINWIKHEYRNFKNSRTIRVAYAKKLLGVIGVVASLLGALEPTLNPMHVAVSLIILGVIDDKLRKVTSSAIGDK